MNVDQTWYNSQFIYGLSESEVRFFLWYCPVAEKWRQRCQIFLIQVHLGYIFQNVIKFKCNIPWMLMKLGTIVYLCMGFQNLKSDFSCDTAQWSKSDVKDAKSSWFKYIQAGFFLQNVSKFKCNISWMLMKLGAIVF